MKLSFQEPVSIYCYNLIALHHDIIWYLILIMSLVFWVLIKIIKEFSWYAFKKEKKIMLYYNNASFIKVHTVLLYLWIQLIVVILRIVYQLYNLMQSRYDLLVLKNKNVKIYKFILGKELLEGLYFPSYIKDWDLNVINFLMIERFLSYVLHNKPSNALYFYDGKDNFLLVEKFKHSTILEYVFGIFPSVIIAIILLPSLYLLYSTDEDVDPSYTIKVIGHQWFWSYEYSGIRLNVDNVKTWGMGTYEKFTVNFDSVIIAEDELKKGYKRLLETDNVVLIPCNKVIRFVITSADVLHSWAVPSLGIKTDAVPGRLNQVITIVCKPGVYYGQCSELCGVSHGFMPIVINSTSEPKFLANSIWSGYRRQTELGIINWYITQGELEGARLRKLAEEARNT